MFSELTFDAIKRFLPRCSGHHTIWALEHPHQTQLLVLCAGGSENLVENT